MELIFNGVVGIFMLLYLFFALQLGGSTMPGDIFGAGGFPIVIVILGLIILTIISIDTYKAKKSIDIPLFNFKTKGGKAVTLNALSLLLYVALLNIIGFLLATPLFLIASAKSMGYKSTKALIVYTIVLSISLVLIFGKVFYIPLPRGIGIMREMSYLIY